MGNDVTQNMFAHASYATIYTDFMSSTCHQTKPLDEKLCNTVKDLKSGSQLLRSMSCSIDNFLEKLTS